MKVEEGIEDEVGVIEDEVGVIGGEEAGGPTAVTKSSTETEI